MNSVILFALAVLFVLVLLLIVAFLALSRQVGVLFERITPVGAMINNNGPASGETSAVFNLPSLNKGMVTIGGLQNKHQLVLFVSPSCPICKVLFPVIRSINKSEGWLNVVLASDGDEQAHRQFIEHQQLSDIPYVLSPELGIAWRVAKLPFSVLLDEQGKIVSKGLINSREQLESLFNAKESGFASLQDYAHNVSTASLNH